MLNPRVVVVVQSRMGSTRFPGKSMAKIGNHHLIEWVLIRLTQSFISRDIVLAIPDTAPNLVLESIAIKHMVTCVRGSENDVLSRFLVAAQSLRENDYVVRVCADNPFISGRLLNLMTNYAVRNKLPFVHSLSRAPNYPYVDGLGAEIFTKRSLLELDMQANTFKNREHVTLSAYTKESAVTVHGFPTPHLYRKPYLKLDIDTFEDYLKINEIVLKDHLKPESTDLEIITAFHSAFTSAKKKDEIES